MPTNTSTLFDQPPPHDWPPKQLVLFLDECVPEEVGVRIKRLLAGHANEPDVQHLTDFKDAPGTPDEQWAEKIQQLGWLPLTADRGKSNIGRKLPAVLRELNVLHIVLSARVHQLKTPEKAAAIIACWPRIVAVWKGRIGCCHVIRFDSRRTSFRLVEKP